MRSLFRRSTLYRTASILGDLKAVRTGRLPERLVRKAVWRGTSRLARMITKALGVSR